MVYCGKPSTGCQNCRKRRIKCDETRPHCKACVRTGRSCPGYPHPLDVMLRNNVAFNRKKRDASTPSKTSNPQPEVQTPQVLPPTPASTSTSESTSTPGSAAAPVSAGTLVSNIAFSGGNPTPIIPNSAALMQPSVPASLFLPMEVTVTSMFFNSYIYSPRDPLILRGFMDLLPQVFSNSQPGSHVHAGTLAVSYFSVGAWTGNRSFLRSSERLVGHTISKIRKALQGDVSQNLDDILIAVLLLSTYEEFCALKEKRHATTTHLRGALALVNSRSPHQRSIISLILENAVHTHLLKSTKGLPYPSMQAPHVWPTSPTAPQSASAQLLAATADLVNLRQAWDRFNLVPEHDTSDVEDLLTRALCLDNNLVAWKHALPAHWKPVPATTIPPSVRQAGMYKNRCDCYSDLWVAGTWNFYRDSRLVMQNIILHCLQHLPGTSADQIQSTMSLMHGLALDICATVPYILGSQTTSVHMSPLKVEYPATDNWKATQSHHQTASLIGGWLVASHLSNLQLLRLDEGIDAWVEEQKERVLKIYTFGQGAM
ncbi:C6 zinc finger domain protein [Aspergillus heteromorphus CBS 117.55]|uniref:C6 zinc finger domain protein n=1 Tax=Aspergillus heteromorphus CBS 117.55 TaxID=1448321 RepID=A0A317X2F8_9EURO|nr:C6 zinc finger domain protein [Aspergillus heteromorphus CBS 117.55]PWY92824.1 C6 zinc finger domain protein [Aspergillus heteromorphus CBS 117.55]